MHSSKKTSWPFLLSAGRIKCGNSEIPRIVPNEGSATPLSASRAMIIRSFSVFLRISGTFLNEYAKWASHANSPTSASAATEQEREEELFLRQNHRCRIHISFSWRKPSALTGHCIWTQFRGSCAWSSYRCSVSCGCHCQSLLHSWWISLEYLVWELLALAHLWRTVRFNVI